MSMYAAICDFLEDGWRFIRTLIAFMIGTWATATAFQAKHDVRIMMQSVTKHDGIVAILSNGFTFTFSFMYLVNIGCVIYSMLGLSYFRYMIFRERENESTKCRAIQCLLGPCCAGYQQTMVWITLCIQIGVSYLYLSFAIFVSFLLIICRSGNAVIHAFQGVTTAIFHGGKSPTDPGWFMSLNMKKYCVATHGIDQAAMQCFWGCLLSVVSQVFMIMCVSEEKGRIEATMAEGDFFTKSKKKGRKGSDSSDSESDSDSSSSSDEDRPRNSRYGQQHRNQPGGGRNYMMAGGRNMLPR